MKTIPSKLLVPLLLILTSASALSQGMPVENREAIHKLFDNHRAITREFKMTEKGYEATTESKDPEVARAIKRHVNQMSERLESGLMVRRWDPAFEEYVAYYDQIDHKFQPTQKGIRVVVQGRNPKAVKVAQNHAKVLAAFIQHGWDEHDKAHAKAASGTTTDLAAIQKSCCMKGGPEGAACRKPTSEGQGQAKACCQKEGGDCKSDKAPTVTR